MNKKLLFCVLGVAAMFALAWGTLFSDEVIGFVVEEDGGNHLWYVNPVTRQRYFLNNVHHLLVVIEKNLTGISEKNFSLLQEDSALKKSLKGQLLLRVEQHGELWYVDPNDGTLISMGRIDSLDKFFEVSELIPQRILNETHVSNDSPDWLIAPTGYQAQIAATEFTKPRVLAFDQLNQLYVSDFKEDGDISVLLDTDGDGTLETKKTIISHLYNPHGIAFAENKLYVATEHALFFWYYDPKITSVISPPTKIMTIPAGGENFAGQGHKTRTIINGGDGFLYLSVGSNCDHCVEPDQEYGVIYKVNVETNATEIYSRGLRNTVFFIKDPRTGILWGNDMGQDNLGPDLPPDELNQIQEGAHYGWPYCYANRQPTMENISPERCSETTPNVLSYTAHSAPLGLRMIPQTFSREFGGDVLVSLHGSSVIDEKRGYKIIRIEMENGFPSEQQDFIGGFIQGEVILGRPVDVIFDQAGNLYVTDDYARVIHKISKLD